jgi:glutamate synthase domain-containing protein 1
MNNMIHEECGVLGIFKKGAGPLARITYDGLFALQHRGQESCGIVINDDGLFYSHKDLGLVGDVFTKDIYFLIDGIVPSNLDLLNGCKICQTFKMTEEEITNGCEKIATYSMAHFSFDLLDKGV